MFDLSFAEIVIIAVVALVVIKPEDFPVVMKAAGGFLRKIKNIAGDFMGIFDDITSDSSDKESKTRNIVDLDGNIQKTYDVSELAELTKKKKKD